jgi:hypothetical protein
MFYMNDHSVGKRKPTQTDVLGRFVGKGRINATYFVGFAGIRPRPRPYSLFRCDLLPQSKTSMESITILGSVKFSEN